MRAKLFLTVLAFVVFTCSLTHAGFEDDFRRASSSLRTQRKAFDDIETAELVVDTTSVLHKENQRILEALQSLEEKVAGLERLIKELKARVEVE